PPLALTHRGQRRKLTRFTTEPVPQSFVQHWNLIPTITRLSDMAMVARGVAHGTDIGSERRRVREQKTDFTAKILDHALRPPGRPHPRADLRGTYESARHHHRRFNVRIILCRVPPPIRLGRRCLRALSS